MILKFKDSRNNWKYVTLGDFVVNSLDLTKHIEKILNQYTLEEISKRTVEREVLESIGIYINKITDIDCYPPYIDWNAIHKLNKVIIVYNEIPTIELTSDNLCGTSYLHQGIKYDRKTYVISDECYLMDNNGKTIEKLM